MMTRALSLLGALTVLAGSGWSGAGGPWIHPARSMQHLRASSVQVTGTDPFVATLPVPAPRPPSPFAGLSPELAEEREAWHADVAVLAFPTPAKTDPPELLDVKALHETQPYSIWKHVPRYLPAPATYPEPPADATVQPRQVLELTDRLRSDGSLDWNVAPRLLDSHALRRAQHRCDDPPRTHARPRLRDRQIQRGGVCFPFRTVPPQAP